MRCSVLIYIRQREWHGRRRKTRKRYSPVSRCYSDTQSSRISHSQNDRRHRESMSGVLEKRHSNTPHGVEVICPKHILHPRLIEAMHSTFAFSSSIFSFQALRCAECKDRPNWRRRPRTNKYHQNALVLYVCRTKNSIALILHWFINRCIKTELLFIGEFHSIIHTNRNRLSIMVMKASA